jgi:hypothetical protein
MHTVNTNQAMPPTTIQMSSMSAMAPHMRNDMPIGEYLQALAQWHRMVLYDYHITILIIFTMTPSNDTNNVMTGSARCHATMNAKNMKKHTTPIMFT